MTPIASKIPLTRKPVSSRSRSIAKTLTWRVFAEFDTFLVSYLTTGSRTWSLSIVGIESTTKTVLDYLHERLGTYRQGRHRARGGTHRLTWCVGRRARSVP